MNGDSDMTLAFELEALKQLANPSEVFEDARGWSKYVGVISGEPTYVVTNYTRNNRIRQDFFSGPRGREESLQSVKLQFESERYVFIGTSEADETLAEDVEWEYLPIEAAAEAAEWTIAEEQEVEVEDKEPERDDWP